ncbi:hypothetical protein VFPPC_18758 [Pochonia chlamydosporia 170]|uniref:Uncharacterized protein n=1 Tax=Pochonia chlamydosporia 170 TaxID=1380566 RepID=A0A219ATK0_METCM|nr:hypothetical protein VFPPC_18758 [Pochonia chlamydosporia 170]OWT43515.1 hypothetical protein VFPPC_18758 [Pochonia chlamydosporia 170]
MVTLDRFAQTLILYPMCKQPRTIRRLFHIRHAAQINNICSKISHAPCHDNSKKKKIPVAPVTGLVHIKLLEPGSSLLWYHADL